MTPLSGRLRLGAVGGRITVTIADGGRFRRISLDLSPVFSHGRDFRLLLVNHFLRLG